MKIVYVSHPILVAICICCGESIKNKHHAQHGKTCTSTDARYKTKIPGAIYLDGGNYYRRLDNPTMAPPYWEKLVYIKKEDPIKRNNAKWAL